MYMFIASKSSPCHIHITLHPWNNSSEWQEFNSGVIESNWVSIPNWNPPTPWPEIHNGNNTCYGIGITIWYQDNTDGTIGFCEFTEWECFIVG